MRKFIITFNSYRNKFVRNSDEEMIKVSQALTFKC